MTWRRRGVEGRVGGLVVFLVAVLVYAGSLGGGFPNDDRDIVLQNESIHDLASLPDALRAPYWPIPFGEDMGLWRPAATATFALEWAAFGDSPAPYHAVSVVAHGLVSVLVFLLAGAFIGGIGPLAAGILFAVHPVHVEAVAGIIGQAENGQVDAVQPRHHLVRDDQVPVRRRSLKRVQRCRPIGHRGHIVAQTLQASANRLHYRRLE